MSLNNGILLNSILRPKLLNNPFASFSLINLHAAHFDDNIVQPFFVFNTFEFTFSVLCLHLKICQHFL